MQVHQTHTDAHSLDPEVLPFDACLCITLTHTHTHTHTQTITHTSRNQHTQAHENPPNTHRRTLT